MLPPYQIMSLLLYDVPDKAASFKPELTEFLKDKNFELVYRTAIDRMSKEIT